MKHKLSFLLVAFFCIIFAQAQVVEPVKWTVEVNPSSPSEGTVVWTAVINQGYHIYGTQQVKDGPVATSVVAQLPDGMTWTGDLTPSRPASTITDKFYDLILTEWTGTISFSRKYSLAEGITGVTLHSTVHFMACSDRSCTPPKSLEFTTVIGDPEQAAANDSVQDNIAKASNIPAVSAGKEDVDGDLIWAPVDMQKVGTLVPNTSQQSFWMLLLMGFAGGLLALLTPCVWPMIPMTLSFFLKRTKSRARSIGDAILYGLSIIVIFLILGIAVTLVFGAGKLNEIATSAVFNIIFFVLLVVFAISFFGAFEIKLPSRWSNAADGKAESTSGVLSIFFMAFTLVLVSFSCTGPIIGTLLVEAAANGTIVGPAVGMGGFALGLALPFTLFAFFPSLLKEMPRSGGWMNSVKVVLGFIELILSLKFLSVADLAYGWRILDREVFIALWVVLFVLLGMYLLGKLRFAHDGDKEHTSVGGFFLAVASLSFAVYLLPGLWGAPLKAVSAFAPPLSTQDFNLYGGTVKEFDNYDEGMRYAAKNGKPVMLDFSGHACVNCRKMEGAVFDVEDVRNRLQNDYVMIRLMVDEKTPLDKPYTVTENGKEITIKTVGDKWSYLQRHKFMTNQQPYYVLLDNDGKPLAAPRAYDENVAEFVQWLDNGLKSYNTQEND